MYDPSWGRLDAIGRPVPGNHEYGYIGSAIEPTGGEGYFTYFGDRAHPLEPGCTNLCKSWYSWDIGNWHMVALDSQCGVVGGCNPGNPQYQWLLTDLNANTSNVHPGLLAHPDLLQQPGPPAGHAPRSTPCSTGRTRTSC